MHSPSYLPTVLLSNVIRIKMAIVYTYCHPLCFSPISRSTLAYFHKCGLKEFKDSKGLSLPQVTLPPTPPVVTDALQHGPYQIGVQFLAFKP